MDAGKMKTKKKRAGAAKASAKRGRADAGKIPGKKAGAAGGATAPAVLAELERLYPNPRHYLKFAGPFQLLVATILSAQCTDEKVNEVTAGLFEKYRGPADFAEAPVEEIERDVRPTGFYRNKAKAVKGASAAIIERFGGTVPGTMEELLTLPGIARKSANAILQHGFGAVEGVVVDTHVIRVAGRLGWTQNTDPEKIERDLMELFDRKEWRWLPFYLKSHGRAVCKAPTPRCGECAVAALCPSALIGPRKAHR
jgi:endonuclease-3